jgi:PKD repeat protein
MKIKLLITLLLTSIYVKAQINIINSDMPRVNDTLRYSNSNLLVSSAPFALTGANYTWNFANLSIENQEVQRYFAPTATPYILQFFQASYGIPEGNLALGPIGGGAASNVFSFYRANAQANVIVGRGATLQSLPLGIVYSSRDTVFKYPLNYQDAYSGNYAGEASFQGLGALKQVGSRNTIVDGWGTITTPYGTFTCLRVKSTIVGTDSIVFGGFGIPIPSERTEYTWLAKGEKYPILEVVVNNLTNQISSIKFKDKNRPEAYLNNANFIANRTLATPGDTITLNSTSVGTPTAFNWQISPNKFVFAAGSNASSASPRLIFTDTGNFTVRLLVNYLGGSDDTIKVNYIRIRKGATAAFSINNNQPKISEIVTLNDESIGDVLTWQWTIIPNNGVLYVNGTSATSKNPALQFNQPGNFAVQLRITHSAGNNTLRKNDYVQVWPTNIKEISEKHDLNFFPNPAFNFIHINTIMPEPIQVSINNFLGQTILSKTITTDEAKHFSVGFLPRGIYLINLVQNEKITSKRLVLE